MVLIGADHAYTNLTGVGSPSGGTYQWAVGPNLAFQGPSKITFTVDGGPSPPITLQAYPTYYEYHNGAFVHEYPEAPTPFLNFFANPFPSGTVLCSKIQPDGSIQITPGGRCGDQASSPDVTARIPSYVQP
jgi:hypothetical protein